MTTKNRSYSSSFYDRLESFEAGYFSDPPNVLIEAKDRLLDSMLHSGLSQNPQAAADVAWLADRMQELAEALYLHAANPPNATGPRFKDRFGESRLDWVEYD